MAKKIDLRGVRVSIDESVHHLYEELVSRSGDQVESRPFATMKDVFMVAACLGAQHNQYQVINKSKVVFNGNVFDPDLEVPILCAIAFKKLDKVEDLFELDKIMLHCQNYANGGIYVLMDCIQSAPGLKRLYKVSSMFCEV